MNEYPFNINVYFINIFRDERFPPFIFKYRLSAKLTFVNEILITKQYCIKSKSKLHQNDINKN